jgi:hypothetical protein
MWVHIAIIPKNPLNAALPSLLWRLFSQSKNAHRQRKRSALERVAPKNLIHIHGFSDKELKAMEIEKECFEEDQILKDKCPEGAKLECTEKEGEDDYEAIKFNNSLAE